MKTLRYIGMALIAVVISVGFAACSDDDDDAQTASDFIGTVWVGTNPNTNYGIEVNIKTASTCLITVYRPDSTEIYDQEECTYFFSETTRWRNYLFLIAANTYDLLFYEDSRLRFSPASDEFAKDALLRCERLSLGIQKTMSCVLKGHHLKL